MCGPIPMSIYVFDTYFNDSIPRHRRRLAVTQTRFVHIDRSVLKTLVRIIFECCLSRNIIVVYKRLLAIKTFAAILCSFLPEQNNERH